MKKLASLILIATLAVACGDDTDGKVGTNNTGTNNAGANNSGTNNAGANNTGANNTGTNNTGTNNTGTNNTGTNNTGSNNAFNNETNNSTNNETNNSTNNEIADGCSVTDPGSDIYGATLESASGEILGWARSIDFIVGSTPNGNDFSDHLEVLDGTEPELDASSCPLEGFTDSSVVALGCIGEIALQFVDSEGTGLVITNGMQITVYEYGANCASDPAVAMDNTYELYACSEDPVGTDFLACVTPIGGLNNTGQVTFAVDTLDAPIEFVTIYDTTGLTAN